MWLVLVIVNNRGQPNRWEDFICEQHDWKETQIEEEEDRQLSRVAQE